MKQYALWHYDSFPYVLGGPVTKMRDNGAVETSNFGNGYYFAPFKILPLKAGEKFMEEAEALRAEYRAAKKAFDAEWDAKCKRILGTSR